MALPLALRFFLGVFPDLDHTCIMAVHAVYALTGLGKDELFNSFLADFTSEAVGMIRIVARHDCFVKNWEVADIAVVGTIGTYG